MRANVHISNPDEYALLAILEGICQANVHYLRENPDTPRLYDSGVFYEREPEEEWYDIGSTLQRDPPRDDCEGLSSWRAAELRVAGYEAHPVLRRYQKADGRALYHAITEIRTPAGYRYDDPSARLGMLGNRPRIAGDGDGRILQENPALWKPVPNPAELSGVPKVPQTVRLMQVWATRRGTWSTFPDHPTRRTRTIAVVGNFPPTMALDVAGDADSIVYYFSPSGGIRAA